MGAPREIIPSAGRRVFELRPLVSEDFGDRKHMPIPQILSEELDCMRRAPLVSEEFRILPNAPTVRLLSETLAGSYLVSVKSEAETAGRVDSKCARSERI